MEEYLISAGMSAIMVMLKKPSLKRKYKNAMLKLRNSINIAFGDDKDFK